MAASLDQHESKVQHEEMGFAGLFCVASLATPSNCLSPLQHLSSC